MFTCEKGSVIRSRWYLALHVMVWSSVSQSVNPINQSNASNASNRNNRMSVIFILILTLTLVQTDGSKDKSLDDETKYTFCTVWYGMVGGLVWYRITVRQALADSLQCNATQPW